MYSNFFSTFSPEKVVAVIIILLIVLLIFKFSRSQTENTYDKLSRTKRWENSLPDEAPWWENAKKSGETFVLGVF